jgi:hypothetical protein
MASMTQKTAHITLLLLSSRAAFLVSLAYDCILITLFSELTSLLASAYLAYPGLPLSFFSHHYILILFSPVYTYINLLKIFLEQGICILNKGMFTDC